MTNIVIKNLTCRYGDHDALTDIDTTISEQRIGIIGRNGSGKSTLAQAICGLLEPQNGSVTVNGIDVLKDRKEAIQTVGILFQNPDHQIIFPTVVEEISFGLRQLGRTKAEAKEKALDVLAQFDRSEWATRSISTFSQGQRQLICLMAVLAMEPQVIVLDEPFSGLDIPTKRALQNRFSGLEQTLIHITHDPETISTFDRIIWIENGRIHMDGAPDTVLKSFKATMESCDASADL